MSADATRCTRHYAINQHRTLVAQIVDLVKNQPTHFAHDLGPAIQHVAQNLEPSRKRGSNRCGSPKSKLKPEENAPKKGTNLGGHNEAGGRWINGHITRHQTHVVKLLVQLTVLLIGQGLDGARVNDTLIVPQRHGNCVSASKTPTRLMA